MTTALDIITGAAKLIGIVFKSEALDADEASDGLVQLNDMLDSWSNDDLVTYAYTLESFSLTGATSYTIGSGGTFSTSRPINIATAVVRVSTVDYPLQIITPEQYQLEVSTKGITSTIPEYLTYDNGYPLGTITMYAVPTSGSTLRMLSNKPLSNLSALTTTVDLPPGWKKALKYNLALDMAPQYGEEPAPSIVAQAKLSLGAIKRATAKNKAMPYMPQDSARYSIYSGTPGN
jgi:hypothetical protein